MESKPDTIKISAVHKEEIFATHADLHVTVKGSSIFSGSEAMKKAKEVTLLIEALSRLGVKEDASPCRESTLRGRAARCSSRPARSIG